MRAQVRQCLSGLAAESGEGDGGVDAHIGSRIFEHAFNGGRQ